MKTLNTLVLAITTLGLIATTTIAAAGDYQHKALLNPSSSQLQAETNGRVMIYDRLDNDTVELAMSQQFERIESMMFVRTQYTGDDDSAADEDDCV
jgi:hypothetical protein